MAEIKIGPTFGDELFEAGVGGLPFSWSDTGEFNGLDALSEDIQKKVKDVLKKHDPTKVLLSPMDKLEARVKSLEDDVKALKGKKK